MYSAIENDNAKIKNNNKNKFGDRGILVSL